MNNQLTSSLNWTETSSKFLTLLNIIVVPHLMNEMFNSIAVVSQSSNWTGVFSHIVVDSIEWMGSAIGISQFSVYISIYKTELIIK